MHRNGGGEGGAVPAFLFGYVHPDQFPKRRELERKGKTIVDGKTTLTILL